MRIIDVPKETASIEVPTRDGCVKRDVDFTKFLLDIVDSHGPFGKGTTGIRQGIKIVTAIEGRENGVIRLEDAEHEALKAAMEGCPFIPCVARSCERMGYFKAVENAQPVEAPPITNPPRKA